MKKIRYSFLFFVLLVGSVCSAQTISTDKSAVVHSKFRTATTDPNAAANTSQAQININYLDGLGRGEQGVGYKQSPLQKDLVQQTQIYDTYGREVRQVLPSVAPTSNGSFQGNAQSLANTFYGDNNAFTETTLFDNSPLNRTREQYGAGQAWRTGNKKTQVFYESAGNTVRRYVVDASGNINLSGTYPKGVLLKTRVVDEQGHTAVEIKDRLDRVVEKWVQDDSGFMITHYVFDSFRRLRAIIQPQGYALNSGFSYNSTNYQNYVFAYEYDTENRIGRKHIPGAGWTNFVYDKADRPVLEQSALQAQSNKWSFTKYDLFGRVIMTGELVNANSQATLQTAFEAVANPYETWNGSSYTNQSYPISYNPTDVKQVNYYDTYDWRPTALAYNATGAYNSGAYEPNATGMMTGNKRRSSDNINQEFLTVMYYDDKGRMVQSYETHHKGGANLASNPIRTDYEYNFAGEVVTEKVSYKIDGFSDTESLTTNEYDHIGRILKVFHSINGANGQELCRYGYDEIGRLTKKIILPNGTYLYGGTPDYITRETSPNANIDDLAKKAVTILPNTEISTTYSAMIDPNAAAGTSINGLQTMDYSYHIRGGLRGMNLDGSGNAVPNASQGDLFSFKLDYETAGQYDGNIGKQTWKNDTEAQRSYVYSYDPAKRLKTAAYTGVGSEDFSIPSMSYDKNGNISYLARNGKTATGFGGIDRLFYAYSGNRLTSVADFIATDNEVDLVPQNGGAYTYYADGSLKSDANEQIQNIVYDTFLKQPTEVVLTDGRKIKHFYDGGGRLIKTVYYDATNTVLETWEYVGQLIFKNGVPYQLSTPDGRAVYNNTTSQWEYEFDYKDHLGNTRVSFKDSSGHLVKTAETAFDPWGVRLNGVGSVNGFQNRWEMQGKEREQTFGLNRVNFGARTYNPTNGRWDRSDPLAELDFHLGSYVYVGGDPVNSVDMFGMYKKKIKKDTYEETVPFDEVVVTAKRPSMTSAYSLFDLAFMSRNRNKQYHDGVGSPYGQHFQDGSNFAVGAVGVGVGAGMLASVPIVANSVSAGASYMANLRYASAGRWLLRKSFDMKGAKTLWKSKIALSLTAQGISAYFNDAPLKFDVADVIADVFTTPLIGAIAGSQFDLNINMSGQISGKIGNFSKGGASDFTWGLASNLSDGVISKYGGKALGGVSEFKNFSLQLYQKAYFQMFNDVSKSDK